MDLKISGRYLFRVERIWFDDFVFTTMNNGELMVYEYPNNQIYKTKITKNIESIRIDTEIKIIYTDRTHKVIQNLCLENIVGNNNNAEKNKLVKNHNRFQLINDHIYFNKTLMFIMEGTYNIRIVEDRLKLYRYSLHQDYYEIEEYDLFFIINSFLFDSKFFMLTKIDYSVNYLFSSNKNDFVVCSDKTITINMMKCREMPDTIEKVDMSEDNIVITTKKANIPMIYIFNIHLEPVYNGINIVYYVNCHHGILIKDKNVVLQVNGSLVTKTDHISSIIRNDPFTNIAVKKTKIHFSIYNNDIIFYFSDNFHLKAIFKEREIVYTQNGEHLGQIQENDLYSSNIKIANVDHFDCYLNRFVAINSFYIIIKVGNIFCKKVNTLKNIISCDAKKYSITYMIDGVKKEINLYEMVYSIATVIEIKLEDLYCYEQSLEKFMYDLIIHENVTQLEELLKKLEYKVELVICRLYRKCEDRIRKLLIEILPTDYFDNIVSSEGMAIIFLCYNLKLKTFVERCVYDENESRLLEIYDYFVKTENEEKISEMINVLWGVGCTKILKQIMEIDLTKYYFITEMNKKL